MQLPEGFEELVKRGVLGAEWTFHRLLVCMSMTVSLCLICLAMQSL